MAAKLWRTPTVVPALAYEDVPAAVEDHLGFTFTRRSRAFSWIIRHS
jgi:hypothetical protein